MNEEIKQFMSDNGRKGGNTTKEKYGKEHYSRMGKKSTENKRKLKEMQTEIEAGLDKQIVS